MKNKFIKNLIKTTAIIGSFIGSNYITYKVLDNKYNSSKHKYKRLENCLLLDCGKFTSYNNKKSNNQYLFQSTSGENFIVTIPEDELVNFQKNLLVGHNYFVDRYFYDTHNYSNNILSKIQ